MYATLETDQEMFTVEKLVTVDIILVAGSGREGSEIVREMWWQ